MAFVNIEVNKQAGEVSWLHNGKKKTISVKCPDQAIVFSSAEIILVLAGNEASPSVLYGYKPNGEKQFQTEPPEDFSFSYLTKHPEIDAAIVCGAKQKIDNWYDWHFAIEPHAGRLTRHCPAY